MQAVSKRSGHSFAILNLQILYTVSFLSRFNASAICLGGLISSNEMIFEEGVIPSDFISVVGLNVVLGLNYREALQIGDIVLGRVLSQNETIEKLTRDLGEMLNLNCLLVHRHKEAACFTNNTYYEMSVPYCNTPKLTTGAGDNFNSGFVYAYANQMTPDECLKCAIGTSGYYVRNGHSPTINELVSFFVEWDSGELA